jgi:hypothetical protein
LLVLQVELHLLVHLEKEEKQKKAEVVAVTLPSSLGPWSLGSQGELGYVERQPGLAQELDGIGDWIRLSDETGYDVHRRLQE